MQIVSGSVTFARTVQPAQYETKKAKVTLDFALAEGEQLGTALDDVGALAKAKALEMVGLQAAPVVQNAPAAAAEPVKPDGRRRRVTTPPQEPAPEAKTDPIDPTGPDTKPAISATPENRQDPANPVEPEDPDADIFADVKPAEITDKELVEAVTRVNTKVQNPGAIKAIIKEYVQPPGGVRDIPQDKRKAFLDQLVKFGEGNAKK